MKKDKDIHNITARRIAMVAASIALTAAPFAATNGQVTPTDESAILWTDLGETEVPDMPTKASRDAFATRRVTMISPAATRGGYWATMSDGTEVWTAGIRSDGATSMSLEIEARHMPEGSELSVWGADGQTKVVDTTAGASPIVEGEWIAIQYTGPAKSKPDFEITAAYCGFRRIGEAWPEGQEAKNKAIGQGSSQECEANARCNERAYKLGRAVCRLIINNQNLGTGTLVNNTAGDRSPLVLTSAHVVASNKLRSCTALFGFTEPFCDADGYYSRGTDQIDGAELVAFDAATDMAVLKLKRSPTLASSPYWAGWEREDDTAEGLICVHHPHGDTQKASEASTATARTTYETTDKNATGGSFRTKAFWNIDQWTTGATEGGSSGSALVNASGHVIGALSGGMATCKMPEDDWFWMLDAAWNESSDGYATLGATLDPLGSGAASLEGIDGLATADGDTRIAASYDPRDEVASAALTIGDGNDAIAQSVAATVESEGAKVWAVRLYAETESEAERLASDVEVGISPSGDEDAASYTSAATGAFSSNTVVDYVFEMPVAIRRADEVSVRVRVRNGFQGEGIRLMALETKADGREASVLNGGQWAKAGSTLAVGVTYTQAGGTRDTTEIPEGQVRISCANGTVTLTGEAMSTVAIYDRQGCLTRLEDGGGRTEISIDMCGAATGLYVVRVLCESGKQKTFKILNT